MRLCPVFILLSPTDWRFLETAGIFSIFQNVNCPHWCQLSCGNKPSNTHLKDFVGGRSCSDSTRRARNESNTPVCTCLRDSARHISALPTRHNSGKCSNPKQTVLQRTEAREGAGARAGGDAVLNWNRVLMRAHGAGCGGVSGSHMWGLY